MPDKTDGTASPAGGEEGGAEEERRGDGEKKGTLAKEVTGAGRTRRLSGKGMTKPCSSSLGTHRCPQRSPGALATYGTSSQSVFPAQGGSGTAWRASYYSPRVV